MHPQIAWCQIIATHNRLIHEFLDIDDDILWSVLQDDKSGLLEPLKELQYGSEL